MADGASSPKRAYTTEEYLTITEEQLKASAAQQQGQIPSVEGNLETQSQPQGYSFLNSTLSLCIHMHFDL